MLHCIPVNVTLALKYTQENSKVGVKSSIPCGTYLFTREFILSRLTQSSQNKDPAESKVSALYLKNLKSNQEKNQLFRPIARYQQAPLDLALEKHPSITQFFCTANGYKEICNLFLVHYIKTISWYGYISI